MTETQNQHAPQAQSPVISETQLKSLLESVLDKTEMARGTITMTAEGVEFSDFAGVQRYARMLVEADMVPEVKNDTPQKALARATAQIIMGRRIGLSPEQSVQDTYVVNRRVTLFGDTPLAICRQHKSWDESGFDEWFEVDGKRIKGNPAQEDWKKHTTRACCSVLRKGAKEPRIQTFSIGDAQQAGLFGRNANLYNGYTFRMLLFRARGYCLRDTFADALKGIGIKELSTDVFGNVMDNGVKNGDKHPEPPGPGREVSVNKNGKHTSTATSDPVPTILATADSLPPTTAEGEIPADSVPSDDAADAAPSDDEMARADTISAFSDRIHSASSLPELQSIERDLAAQQMFLGTSYEPLHASFVTKARSIAPAAFRKRPTSA
jgi:hypothetical protein